MAISAASAYSSWVSSSTVPCVCPSSEIKITEKKLDYWSEAEAFLPPMATGVAVDHGALSRDHSRDRKTGSPLGYAYVNFRYRDDAERAIDMFNFELLLERPMRVMWSNWEPTAKPIKGGNIFIRNLDWSIDCTSLFDTFSVFGRIVSCKVVESKGFGYVQYESAEAAALAIERLNGKLLNDRQVTIEYFRSWEERKVEVRRAEEPKVEVHRAEEPKVEARKAEEPKVEARPSSQHQGNRKFIKKIGHTIHRKCLQRAPSIVQHCTMYHQNCSNQCCLPGLKGAPRLLRHLVQRTLSKPPRHLPQRTLSTLLPHRMSVPPSPLPQ
ncbi:uncharacterized protein LOC131349728 [Hemibagrus wyckioides]|uniref:uncharacterized protein LOC131349728 n=1 Tax=Hemibagrus wyckioides TaxID=337641 RepID=UPI00266C867C|nr:uncharacterized protein LOC131349728 [Hemibagrus wyckioides]